MCNGMQTYTASYMPNRPDVLYYYNDQYTVVMQKMANYGTYKQVDYSKYYVNKYYQRVVGCDGW